MTHTLIRRRALRLPLMLIAGIRALTVFCCVVFWVPHSYAAWAPTFVDNFNDEKLAPSKWVKGQENLDRQLQAYRDEAISETAGSLHLKILDKPYYGRPYTAGAVTTQGLFAQQYGYFEVRAKMAGGNGLWPAFWLLPQTGQWTSEIDIFEYIGNRNAVHHAFHYGWRSQNQHGATKADFRSLLNADYHVYGLHWTADKIEYFIDGRLTHRITDRAVIAKADKPMFVMLNTALASQHTGWISGVNKSTDFSQQLSVDYVRVYKQSSSGKYSELPSATDNVPDTENAPYDNVAVSIESLDRPDSTPAINREGRAIRDRLKLTAHADVNAVLWISLHKAKNFNANGRFESDKLNIIERPLRLVAGETSAIGYEFPAHLSSDPGLYHVDLVVRDKQASHSNRAAGRYKTFQFLGKQASSAIYFDAYVIDVSAKKSGDELEAKLSFRIQEALLTPYLTAYYRLKDPATGAVYAEEQRKIEHTSMGTITIDELLTVAGVSAEKLVLEVAVGDASGENRTDYFSAPVSQKIPPAPADLKVR